LRWNVDPEAGPIFEQIAGAVEAALARGELKPGDKLPSARALAEELRVNPNTVIRAFEVLEQQGITETRRGLGTFVREDLDVGALKKARIGRAARRYLAEVRALGLGLKEAKDALEEVKEEDGARA